MSGRPQEQTAGVPSSTANPGRIQTESGNPNDDADKRKKERETDVKWKGIFMIDSEMLRTAKARPCRNMKCDVDKFERGTDLMIKDWINQMETYFTVCQVPAEAFIGSMLMKIAPDI